MPEGIRQQWSLASAHRLWEAESGRKLTFASKSSSNIGSPLHPWDSPVHGARRAIRQAASERCRHTLQPELTFGR